MGLSVRTVPYKHRYGGPTPGYPFVGGPVRPRKPSVIVIDDFETITGWSFYTPTPDTVNVLSGSQSAKITSSNNTQVNALKSVQFDMRGKYLEVWFYVDDVNNLARLAIGVHRSPSSGYLWDVTAAAKTGWSCARICFMSGEAQDGTFIDKLDLASDVRYIYFRVQAKAGLTVSVSFDRVTLVDSPLERGVILFTFDDWYRSVFTKALPILNKYDYPATYFVTTSQVGVSGNVTVANLTVLQQMGWAIGSHGEAHVDFTTLSTIDLRNQLKNSQKWLIDNGFKGRVLAYPYGSYNDSVIAETRRYYEIARRVGLPSAPMPWVTRELMACPGKNLASSSVSAILSELDIAAAMRIPVVYFSHAIDEPYFGGTEITSAEFESVVQKAHSLGLEGWTFEDLLALNHDSLRRRLQDFEDRLAAGSL